MDMSVLKSTLTLKSSGQETAREPSDTTANIIRVLALKSKNNGAAKIAPGIAGRILEDTNFDGQRRVSDGRVAERVADIEHGRWNPHVCPITFAGTPDGHLYLVNGQHRCHAINKSARAVENIVSIIPAQDLDEVRRIYALFDTPESRRSDSDMLHGVGIGEALGLKRKTTLSLFKALSVLRNDLEPVSGNNQGDAKSRNGRLGDMTEWVSEAALFEKATTRCDSWLERKLSTGSAMAAFLFLLRHQKAKGYEFLAGIAANDGLRKNDPRARLIADFTSRATSNGSMRQSVQRVSVAWNAFYEGRDLTIIKCMDGPLIFKGTPKGRVR